MENKCAIYARVSTKDQSPDSQLLILRRYCEARGFSIFGEYVDIGVSGKKQNRPALNKLMNDARKRQIDILVIFKLDRLGRSLSHLCQILEEFQNLGIAFISYTENVDFSNSSGKLMFHLLSAMAEFERDLIRERVKAGLEAARKKGRKLGRPQFIDRKKVIQLRSEEKLSLRKIAARLKISQAAVHKIVNEYKTRSSPLSNSRHELCETLETKS